jgi:Fe-S cluster biogenesis protein NfuA
MADGGNVEFVEIDGPVVRLKLQGACGSCPASTTTMTMGIERRLKESIPEVLEVEQVRIMTNVCANSGVSIGFQL